MARAIVRVLSCSVLCCLRPCNRLLILVYLPTRPQNQLQTLQTQKGDAVSSRLLRDVDACDAKLTTFKPQQLQDWRRSIRVQKWFFIRGSRFRHIVHNTFFEKFYFYVKRSAKIEAPVECALGRHRHKLLVLALKMYPSFVLFCLMNQF